MLSGEQWNQLLQGFLDEGRDLLKDAEDSLLRLETTPDDHDAVNGLFRAVHTLKGSAGIFSLTPLVTLTHHLESLLMSVRDGQRVLTSDLTSLMLKCMDELSTMLESVDPDNGVMEANESRQAPLLAALAKAQGHEAVDTEDATSDSSEAVISDAEHDWQVSIAFARELFQNGFDPAAFVRYLKKLGTITSMQTQTPSLPELGKLDPEDCYLELNLTLRSSAQASEIEDVFEFIQDFCTLQIERLATQPESDTTLVEHYPVVDQAPVLQVQALAPMAVATPERPSAAPNPNRDRRPVENTMVKVAANKLDELINLVGELVISTAGAQMQARLGGHNGSIESTQAVLQHVEQIREIALKLRMVEVGETFNRFHRVVRDVSQELDKKIQLTIRGGETELDKSVIDKVADPLTHLVRNAIDHGIESAADRLAVGKPAEGNLSLNAYHDSGMIVLEISDDGRGLNTARILEKAIAKGMVEPDAQLSDSDIHLLIFEAGFSTAEQVSNLSGRGVGMDVVRSAIDQLRGTIEIDSVAGEGCTFRIRLPLTLAIIDGFLVSVGQDSFVIPLDVVTECMEATAPPLENGYGYLNLRGRPLPCIALDSHFGIKAEPSRRRNIVVVSQGRQQAGLIVDQLHGELQTVIKPLGKMFQHLRGISGSTILGSGQVALILDIPSLFRHLQAQVESASQTSVASAN
ncbi:chemotaxis protein CheA [Pseudomonas cichorii]|uniref:Chemotaxis protein CheA n=1 Tax=Pseudomonas cichorii TaxID=36746 RepID=A0A3M4WFZ6_PSECI|nr:chemotaxis protein CheA [Pseudomonas cichorii]AHF68850.1 CheA signal transduction histidine kinase [Pseudomonas cichorii JBC1]QVE15846.1 chemotaxis protein CheA [Pseudomonas cichorii]RMR62960.1 CheA signal transduction histidine kinase [Pseudomonas cichorii]SDN28114.1 two-component system, chemotaxis family, sensor kinase CheA [Pseudomonas cichorii]GFM75878.1 chemotaxis protein CheA [Pseudomonas cichorii]